MSEHRDYKAEFGSQPSWHLQREKQEAAAEEYYGEVEELSPEEIENMDKQTNE